MSFEQVIVDTTVWIDYLRGDENPETSSDRDPYQKSLQQVNANILRIQEHFPQLSHAREIHGFQR
jgi:hypothetical protein